MSPGSYTQLLYYPIYGQNFRLRPYKQSNFLHACTKLEIIGCPIHGNIYMNIYLGAVGSTVSSGGSNMLPTPKIIQDQDTLIEQSVKYSNRTVTTHNTIENPS